LLSNVITGEQSAAARFSAARAKIRVSLSTICGNCTAQQPRESEWKNPARSKESGKSTFFSLALTSSEIVAVEKEGARNFSGDLFRWNISEKAPRVLLCVAIF